MENLPPTASVQSLSTHYFPELETASNSQPTAEVNVLVSTFGQRSVQSIDSVAAAISHHSLFENLGTDADQLTALEKRTCQQMLDQIAQEEAFEQELEELMFDWGYAGGYRGFKVELKHEIAQATLINESSSVSNNKKLKFEIQDHSSSRPNGGPEEWLALNITIFESSCLQAISEAEITISLARKLPDSLDALVDKLGQYAPNVKALKISCMRMKEVSENSRFPLNLKSVRQLRNLRSLEILYNGVPRLTIDNDCYLKELSDLELKGPDPIAN